MAQRIERLYAAVANAGASAIYIRNTPDIEWACGFEHVFDDERAHALLVHASTQNCESPFFAEGSPRAILHTDSRYVAACKREAARLGGIEVDDTVVSHAKWAAQLLCSNDSSAIQSERANDLLAIEDTMSLREYSQLEEEFSASKLKVTRDVVLSLRAVKDAEEIKKLKAAQAITDAAFASVLGQIRPGITESELRNLLDAEMFALGADTLAFPTIIACGENGASPHAQPGNRKLEAGQCIVMDFGAKLDGYCSDMTRTVFLGQPSSQMRAAWQAIHDANAQVRAMLKPGVTGVEAHNLAEQILAKAGFEGKMGHGLGHGVGLEIHELPNLNRRNNEPLEPGNVVTVEPGVYIEGAFGMRLEDFGVVTQDGFETFTRSTHEMIVL